MAFVHGKNTRVVYGPADLSEYFNDLSVSQERDVNETTTFGRPAKTYIGGLRDGSVSASGLFDGTAGAVDAVLSDRLGQAAGVPLSALPAGDTLGARAMLASVKSTSYEVDSPAADVVSVSAEFGCDGGVDGGEILQTMTSLSASGDATEVDSGEASANGGVAHLHVVAIDGTDPTVDVVIEESATGSVWVPLTTFVQADQVGSQRIIIAAGTTIARYLRASRTLGGTSPSCTLSVSLARRS